ncbi:MAG: bifunctional methylenetetrahydrofolate dehydrogenase/methenyltetrahydrofolate cyclohydrolase FolD [Pseudonocardia sp.]|uniref:bifunctional methylenetetrahydrofolate dehydrogenase/methenyltetrahydrofolate cyclohydrolase FolD n=1 Tax=unclassified Pseudonocardia TaxID=2619320 RepID=UPI00086DD362|nr:MULTISPECIES: bifunctional methylenetetrahydrofolate dehydrogenase/methenyltetrahydrofolate cyclohydrolase FolD [unclassified Pseudonocardia]MBN9107323.1 bifunctional methylenetetrahydrofolate dehydrogenase/methenyltetrahydrofolate cyclohydrolase FolD [Pseudonocardia sp.]ODU19537.1 MAG: bifunctional 5,10-methylene-tetrahydrofolate dehydrogenase/5,10-methylene-tetrahydrofolate cyclohydrolase [Pseudonocardia sp. SCN 72-51]ODV06571.1 MAG: bifunctional 5,10-methylene-tetrahydrofolate dehydrogenas
MPATVIDGKVLAARLREEVAAQVASMEEPPGLATLLVGDDPASEIYVRNKRRLCTQVGMRDLHRHLRADVGQAELAAIITELNADPAVTGILLQLPLPGHLRADDLLALIDPDKDVDGLTEASAGRLALGKPGLRPCTPSGVIRMLDSAGVELRGKHAVVVGRSNLVGKPQAQLLLERDATVSICHRHTTDLAAITRTADVLVVAAGVPHLVGADAVAPGATVIDVGIHRTDTGLCGDVDTEAVARVAGAVTPVPGGVGPMTIAMLLWNTVEAARLRSAEGAATV